MHRVRIFVLCAGEGKRLRPYTERQPKCCIPYRGKPLLSYQLETFQALQLNDIVLIGGYCHSALPKTYPLVVNDVYASTNMLYSLFCARSFMDEGPDWVVSYGDIIYHPSVLQALLAANDPVSVVTDLDWRHYWSQRMEQPLTDAETFRWDPQTRRIFELGKRPQTLADIQGQYIGLIKISASATGTIKQLYDQFSACPHARTAYMTDFLQFLIDEQVPVYGVPIHNHWAEFDRVNDLQVSLDWL